VHDDPFGTWTRSERYRLFRPLLGHTFPSILRAANSIDVTSWGMRNLYREQYGVKCFSVYLHILALPNLNVTLDPTRLTVGHIGTLYHPEPFRRFVAACRQVAAEQHRHLRIVRVGTSSQMDEVAASEPDLFVAYGDVSEPDAISILASCDFFYAMYPEGQRFELFRKTSLPIKLSTYVQAQRPIFAHAPADSTLARIVGPYNLGRVCESNEENEIALAIRRIAEQNVPAHNYELVREALMGRVQVQQLGAALRGEDWQQFPESDFLSE
jgi:hypothetical protein